MNLKYEPVSEPLHISVKQWYLNRGPAMTLGPPVVDLTARHGSEAGSVCAVIPLAICPPPSPPPLPSVSFFLVSLPRTLCLSLPPSLFHSLSAPPFPHMGQKPAVCVPLSGELGANQTARTRV